MKTYTAAPTVFFLFFWQLTNFGVTLPKFSVREETVAVNNETKQSNQSMRIYTGDE